MALREEGVFARMVMEHDLREITQNPDAKLDEDQGHLIQEMVDRTSKPGPQNVFLWGYSGTGKTLFVCEALKIKLSKVRRLVKEGKKVRVIVTVYNSSVTDGTKERFQSSSSLMADMRGKYLMNVAGDEFVDFVPFKVLLQDLVGDFLTDSEKLANVKFDKNTDFKAIREGLARIRASNTKEGRGRHDEFQRNEIEQPVKQRVSDIIQSLSTTNDYTGLQFNCFKAYRFLHKFASIFFVISLPPLD